MDENEARKLALAYADEHLPKLGKRSWRQTRFDNGWVFVAEGEDLRWRTGVPCVVVTDDGGVHRESSSLPPNMLHAQYAAKTDDPGGPISEGDARRNGIAYAAEHLSELGDRQWDATRFEGGWLLVPRGDDLRWRTGVACVIVTDDGSVHRESSSIPPDERIARYRSPQS